MRSVATHELRDLYEQYAGRIHTLAQYTLGSHAAAEDAVQAVFLKALHAAESGVAARLRALLVQPPLPLEIDVDGALDWFEKQERIDLARQQRQAIRAGLTRKALVITGGPGTGKTTLVRGIVKILEKKRQKILLAAPTGRAAKRLAEAMVF